MTAFDLLTPGEWKCLAHAERRWLANSRQPVPARDLPGIDLLGDGLLAKGYLVKHTPETGVRWELTEGGRLRLQEAMDELAAHDALRLLNVPLEPARERREGVLAPAMTRGARTKSVYLNAGSSADAAEIHTDAGIVRVNVNCADTQTGEPVVVVEFEEAPGWRAEPRSRGNRLDVRLEQKPSDG